MSTTKSTTHRPLRSPVEECARPAPGLPATLRRRIMADLTVAAVLAREAAVPADMHPSNDPHGAVTDLEVAVSRVMAQCTAQRFACDADRDVESLANVARAASECATMCVRTATLASTDSENAEVFLAIAARLSRAVEAFAAHARSALDLAELAARERVEAPASRAA